MPFPTPETLLAGRAAFLAVDAASAQLAAAVAALALLLAWRERSLLLALPAAAVTMLAAADLLQLHAMLARAILAAPGLGEIALTLGRRWVKLGVLAELTGSAAAILVLMRHHGATRLLLCWLLANTAAGLLGELGGWALPAAAAALSWAEELAEVAIGAATILALARRALAPLRQPATA